MSQAPSARQASALCSSAEMAARRQAAEARCTGVSCSASSGASRLCRPSMVLASLGAAGDRADMLSKSPESGGAEASAESQLFSSNHPLARTSSAELPSADSEVTTLRLTTSCFAVSRRPAVSGLSAHDNSARAKFSVRASRPCLLDVDAALLQQPCCKTEVAAVLRRFDGVDNQLPSRAATCPCSRCARWRCVRVTFREQAIGDEHRLEQSYVQPQAHGQILQQGVRDGRHP